MMVRPNASLRDALPWWLNPAAVVVRDRLGLTNLRCWGAGVCAFKWQHAVPVGRSSFVEVQRPTGGVRKAQPKRGMHQLPSHLPCFVEETLLGWLACLREHVELLVTAAHHDPCLTGKSSMTTSVLYDVGHCFHPSKSICFATLVDGPGDFLLRRVNGRSATEDSRKARAGGAADWHLLRSILRPAASVSGPSTASLTPRS
mmetsp:Transcript_52674/g.118188  ORF Transcript_52674/g.118188 Transcript_52674/m.118188 type:complete len:201 (-) Transcript_52674:3-605(-)